MSPDFSPRLFPGNELLSDGTWTYSYDDDGNMVSKLGISGGSAAGLTWTYQYNEQNQLISAVQTETGTSTVISSETFQYDALGGRVGTSITSCGMTTTQQFAYLPSAIDGGNLYAVMNVSGTVQDRDVYGDQQDQVIASDSASSGVSWELTNDQGSVVVQTNSAGEAINGITYGPDGEITEQTNTSIDVSVGYDGQQQDSVTQFVYCDTRYLNTTTGTFTTQDTIGFSSGTTNLYGFTNNDPVNGKDPTGHYLILNSEAELNYWSDKLKAAGVQAEKHQLDDGRWWLYVRESEAAKLKGLTHASEWMGAAKGQWWDERLFEAIASSSVYVTVGRRSISWEGDRRLGDAQQRQIYGTLNAWKYVDPLASSSEVDKWQQGWVNHRDWYGPNISKAQVANAAAKGWGWKQLSLPVYVYPGFKGNVQDIMNRVARYLANYAIEVLWHVVPYRVILTEHEKTWGNTNPGALFSGGTAGPVQSVVPPVPRELQAPRDINERLSNLYFFGPYTGTDGTTYWRLARGQEQFYWKHFPHEPSLFFVNSVYLQGGVYPPGVTPGYLLENLFGFIPTLESGPQYDRTAAHELIHVLGVPDHSKTGLMTTEINPPDPMWAVVPGIPTDNPHLSEELKLSDNDKSWLSDKNIAIIRNSPWLTDMPAPEPK